MLDQAAGGSCARVLKQVTRLAGRGRIGSSNFFFFSRRRRHTGCSRDWSSDVCSSDLVVIEVHDARISCRVRFLTRLAHEDVFGRVFPPRFKPCGNFISGLWGTSKRWTLDLQNEPLAVVGGGLRLLRFGS